MKIAGLVLAGGTSSRMGQDKALLELDGQSQLSRTMMMLARAGLRDTYVSGSFTGFNCIADDAAALGPIGGLSSCAQVLAADYEAMLVVPVDMPLLTPDVLLPLLKNADNCTGGISYTPSQFPMLIKLTPALCGTLQLMMVMPDEQRSINHLIKQLQVEQLPIPEGKSWQFVNTNDPGEWQRACQQYYINRFADKSNGY